MPRLAMSPSLVSVSALIALGAAAPVSASVTNAIADNSNNINAFGQPYLFYVANGSSYAGIATQVTGGNTVGGNSWFGTTAWLRGGVSTANTNVSMQWRTATTAERLGTSTVPPMADSPGYNSMSSDVLQLTGIAQTGPATGSGLIPTNAYALEMTYNPANMIASYQWGATTGWNLANIYASGEAQLTYYSPTSGQWSKELVVINPGASRVENFFGDYAAFALAQGLTATSNLSAYVGSYGFTYVYANGSSGTAVGTSYQMWAILDHTSIFGATPAPGAVALLGMAGLLGGSRRRRS